MTPLTGPLARFGRAGAAALSLWAQGAGAKLEVIDAHPDPAGAMRAARHGRPDALFGPYGSSLAIAAIGAVAAADGAAVWNHGGATSRLAWPEFPRVLNVLAPASTYFEGTLRVVRDVSAHAHTVTMLHADTGFARDVASGVKALGPELGYEVTAISFEPGVAQPPADRAPAADVLLVAGSFEDELAAARTLLARHPSPWLAAGFVGAGVEEVLSTLGDRREGLVGPTQWTASAARALPRNEGPDVGWFVDAYGRATGHEPEYPAAQAFAAGVLWQRCLRDAGSSNDEAVVTAAVQLQCHTLYGAFRLDPGTGRQVGHRVLTVQWQDGVRRVVWPLAQAHAPLRVIRR
ncbi:MAG: ABC transporter substrate-binding protein [Acidimicrobiales bacterium]